MLTNSCFFQCIIRRAKAEKLCAPYDNPKKDPEGHTILRKIIALAFLPSERISEALLLIERAAFDLGKTAGTELYWRNFFVYFRREWMRVVKPENFSIFKSLHRTNNVIERYHRDLNEEMGSKPSPKHFIGT